MDRLAITPTQKQNKETEMRVKASSLAAALMAAVVASCALVREFASEWAMFSEHPLLGGTCYVECGNTSVQPFNEKTNTNHGVVQEGQGREVVALWFSTSKAAVCV